jgi:hypothetical protein
MDNTENRLYIDAIIGVGFNHNEKLAFAAEHHGLAKFVGNQHNSEWRWCREKLAELSFDEVKALYEALCVGREGV